MIGRLWGGEVYDCRAVGGKVYDGEGCWVVRFMLGGL